MENNIGIKIRKVREIKNIGQKYLADKLGISQSSYSDIESGKTKVSDQKLNQIATILEVDAETIKNFNDTIIFNSCVKSGLYNTYTTNSIDKIHQLYEQLLNEKDSQIESLKEVINHIKKS